MLANIHYFDLPAYLKAELSVEELVYLKKFLENTLEVGNNECLVLTTDNDLIIKYLQMWMCGIRDPFTGTTAYSEIVQNSNDFYGHIKYYNTCYTIIIDSIKFKPDNNSSEFVFKTTPCGVPLI